MPLFHAHYLNMLTSISFYVSLILLGVAVFYGLNIASGLINLYLRHIDRLSIDREDIQNLGRHTRSGFATLLCAALVHYLGLPMGATLILSFVVFWQLLRISGLISKLEKISLNPWDQLDADS